MDEATFEAWRARQRRVESDPPRVRSLVFERETELSESILQRLSAIEVGQPLDTQALGDTRTALASIDLFERIEIESVPVPGDPGLVDVTVRATEKEWGPHYLRFGLGIQSDLQGGGELDLGVRHTLVPVNALGGEWRNEVKLGTRTRLLTEYYQPLDSALRWFLAPRIEYRQDVLPLLVDRTKVAEVSVNALETALFLGRNLGSWGELRVGYGYLWGQAKPEVALPGLLPSKTELDTSTVSADLFVDTLDSPRFPRSGFALAASYERVLESSVDDSEASSLAVVGGAPISSGPWILTPSVEIGTTLLGKSDVSRDFSLGGFQRLSGLEPRELSGDHLGLAVLETTYQLTERTTRYGLAVYLGASLEVGGVWNSRGDISGRELMVGGSVFVAADTVIGPVYLALGQTEGGDRAAYLFVGPAF